MNKKRNLLTELTESIEEFSGHDQGKITLKTSEVQVLPQLKISADEILSIRKAMNVSRPIFANLIRILPRKLEKWEQARSQASPEAATLIKLIEKYPDTIGRIATL